jgi:hypothetical protein
MKLPTSLRYLLCGCLLGAPLLVAAGQQPVPPLPPELPAQKAPPKAQDADQEEDQTPKGPTRRWSVGLRLQWLHTKLIETKVVSTSTTKPVADYTYTGSESSPSLSAGPYVEYRFWRNLTFVGEFRFRHAEFKQVTTMKSGIVDPNSATDDRRTTTTTQTNKANYWEFPFLVRYQGLWPRTAWGRMLYATGGIELRHIGRVRTGTSYSYADATTDYNENPTEPSRRNQVGYVVGLGIRPFENFMFIRHITPEVRFIGWQGTPFEDVGYRSKKNQVEAGIGFSF